MKRIVKGILVAAGTLVSCCSVLAATVWDPAGNGITPPASGAWGTAANWGSGLPDAVEKAVFNVVGASDCEVSGSFSGMQIVQGDNNVGGTLRILNGGSLTTKMEWSAIGYNDTALAIVDAGGTLTFGQHAWIGYEPTGVGTLEISGVVNVDGMLGLGWNGGDGFVNVLDGGLLALSNIDSGGASIKQNSILDLRGSGQLTLPGDFVSTLQSYVDAGKIRGIGVRGNVAIDLTSNPGFTTAMASDLNPPEPVPELTIRSIDDSHVELSWPRDEGLYKPEHVSDLNGTGTWSQVNRSIDDASNLYSQVVSSDEQTAFYRLYAASIDNTTLSNKSMMGYQGWFSANGDGTQINDRWHHWGGGWPNITEWGIDFYPDMSEYTLDELYAPGWTLNNGETAYLYSAAHPKSVERHCRWMWEYGIDGIYLQRFLNEVTHDNRFISFRNTVTENVMAGAETYGRLFAIMYDVSGVDDADLLNDLTNDWDYLTGVLDVTNSPAYANHEGKPVVAIWGIGFKNRGLLPATSTSIINYFKAQGVCVMGGVPDGWRDLSGSSETNQAWASVYRSLDIISPWTVGRPKTIADVDNWRIGKIDPDLAEATSVGADYLPVIFPGFSWHNAKKNNNPRPPLNQIPRLGGDFYWRQAYHAVDAGCSMIYTAMFDEVDEGTAMYKVAATTNEVPAGSSMATLDIDGHDLPTDCYLRLGGEAGKMLRGEITVTNSVPINP